MSSELFPCPNPKCGYWNVLGCQSCVRCKKDLGQATTLAARGGAGGKKSLYMLAGLVAAFVVVVGVWYEYESKWSDKEPPKLVIITPAQSPVIINTNTIEITGAVRDTNGHHVTSGGVTAKVKGEEFTLRAPVPEGGKVQVIGYDRHGNASEPVTIEVVMDTVVPEIAGMVPADGSVVYLANTILLGTATEDLGSAKVNEQDAALNGAEFSATVALVPGPNVIKVQVKDKGGNTAEKTITVTLRERALPEGMAPSGRTPAGQDIFKSAKDGAQLVLIATGPFTMGSEAFDADEKPAHEVTLGDYFIDLKPVTNAQFSRFCDATNRELPPATEFDENYMTTAPDSPVTNVTWADARDYAQWAGRRLPTEAEWEKAARGAKAPKFPWGDESPNVEVPRANVKGDADGFVNTSPVGRFTDGASPYGCLDMAGNVWQWVADYYDEKYYKSSPVSDPPGPVSGGDRVLRGGAYTSDPLDTRSTNRHKKPAGVQEDNIGFRTAVSFP